MILELLLNYISLLPISKRKSVAFWNSFLFKKRKYEERKFHNVLCLMLNPRFNNYHLVSSFIGCEKGVNIIEEYDSWSLYPMLLKCYHYLHPMPQFEVEYVNQKTNENFDFDILKQIPNTKEPTMKVVLKNCWVLDITKWIPRKSNVLFNGGENMKPCFILLAFWSAKSLGLFGS